MKQWITADIHGGHGNICRYCNRPWLKQSDLNAAGEFVSPAAALACAERMTEGLITNFNSRIRPEDHVIHVGDLYNRGRAKGVDGLRVSYKTMLARLNGSWTLVTGNHDENNGVKTQAEFMVTKVGPLVAFIAHYPTDSLIHAPALIEYVRATCDVALVGHVHTAWAVMWDRGLLNINVGVDVRKYRPVGFDEIVTIYEQEKRKAGKPAGEQK